MARLGSEPQRWQECPHHGDREGRAFPREPLLTSGFKGLEAFEEQGAERVLGETPAFTIAATFNFYDLEN